MSAQKELKNQPLLDDVKDLCSAMWSRRHTKRVHRALFTLCGTFVLVCTFFVHDYLRDEAKEIRGKLDSSRAETKIKSLILRNRPSPARNKLLATSYGPDLPSRLLVLLDKMSVAVEATDAGAAETDVAKDLLDTLQEHEDRLDLVKEWADATAGVYGCRTDQIRAQVVDLQEKIGSGSAKSLDLQQAFEVMHKKVNESVSCALNEQFKAENLVEDVSATVSDEITIAECRHRRFTVASLFLVPFGLILAAIGQLTGLGEVKAD